MSHPDNRSALNVVICAFSHLVEGSRDDFIPERVVESNRVNNILVPLQRVELLARLGVPNLARSIVASRDKAIPLLVECAVCERQDVGPQHLQLGWPTGALRLLFPK